MSKEPPPIHPGYDIAYLASAALVGIIALAFLAWGVWGAWTNPPPPPTPEQRAQWEREGAAREAQRREREAQGKWKSEQERSLCRMAAACKKYDEARLECAAAGNFKSCLRIKMGADADYSSTCSGGDVGAPAVPLPPETPGTVRCFLLLQ
jgi:hypothetical protein